MSTEPQTTEEAIYYEAIAKAADEREVYLQAACGHDAALLARVRALLRAHEVRDGFLESSPWTPAIEPDGSIVMEGPGTVVGRYKLLEKIGEGGMAVVHMADQEQPLRRKVALKIIKLGMDTRQVVARFEAERQALAMMDHPSIARVFDAGATETGRSYFVMELVQGVSITEYCDSNSLSMKDRLRLFLLVCHAVQHAHQKGIIHRDLKPSNIMVTHHDGQPIPKVIDFGIAKAINQKLTEKTLFTRYGHIIGTPAYMSPEQAELSDLDIDTRSDIYSLGVMLYELLTGTTPFSEEELRRAGYIEMQRVIREQEPLKPSTKISTLGETSTEIANMTRRATTKDPWDSPVNLGPVVNNAPQVVHAKVSYGGSMLYFCPFGRDSSPDIWQVPIIRTVDFSADGKTDMADMALLTDNWGKNEPLCDMAPFPWGDGVVDEKDLAALMESLMTPGPKAWDVPCNVVLSWVSPSIATSSDVYLGTSFEAVSTADRDHPFDVLVSWGQKETSYAPETPLEFSRTYYWRVDTVLGPTNTSICKGPVLSFTTEPFARPVQNIVATASGSQPGMGPQNTVNGSGLDTNDGHSTNGPEMWLSTNADPHWIQFEFDKVYTLHELWVWNSNQLIEPFIGFGAKTVKVEYSSDATAWTPLAGVPEFARAPGKPGYVADTKISFGGVSAKYVKLIIEANWGGVAPSTGLSEVRFFYIPDRSATQP